MRRMGLGLSALAEVPAEEVDECDALRAHIVVLEGARERIERRIEAARRTLESVPAGAEPRADVLLERFDDRYKDDVISRWGEHAFRVSNDWWYAESLEQQRAGKQSRDDLVAAWQAGFSPTSKRAQPLVVRHVQWLRAIPGSPTAEGARDRSIQPVKGLGQMYVNDPRFAATYHGVEGPAFVRDALHEYAQTRM